MIKKLIMTSAAGLLLLIGAMGAEVVVRIAPPRPVVETRVASPGPGYVWVKGYHRWEHRRDGYVFVEGHWK